MPPRTCRISSCQKSQVERLKDKAELSELIADQASSIEDLKNAMVRLWCEPPCAYLDSSMVTCCTHFGSKLSYGDAGLACSTSCADLVVATSSSASACSSLSPPSAACSFDAPDLVTTAAAPSGAPFAVPSPPLDDLCGDSSSGLFLARLTKLLEFMDSRVEALERKVFSLEALLVSMRDSPHASALVDIDGVRAVVSGLMVAFDDGFMVKFGKVLETYDGKLQRQIYLLRDGVGIGSRVVLRDLKASGLNGLCGHIVSVDHERAGVCLESSGKRMAIRYDNLLIDAAAPLLGGAPGAPPLGQFVPINNMPASSPVALPTSEPFGPLGPPSHYTSY